MCGLATCRFPVCTQRLVALMHAFSDLSLSHVCIQRLVARMFAFSDLSLSHVCIHSATCRSHVRIERPVARRRRRRRRRRLFTLQQ